MLLSADLDGRERSRLRSRLQVGHKLIKRIWAIAQADGDALLSSYTRKRGPYPGTPQESTDEVRCSLCFFATLQFSGSILLIHDSAYPRRRTVTYVALLQGMQVLREFSGRGWRYHARAPVCTDPRRAVDACALPRGGY